ncbi:SitI3 family protein [Verrucosispora sp. WMMC514]|uniref:SitI3 family protein n=1 Tax=Verrucosispora sp. WMMC514 TaxID=3015156 RepID=UPI00248CAC1A|nr:SitI3 family protein [Verrucosispora sp. WMMC514]WBB91396.1 SitI3 family protein [Verrucosispora sp. WMMC514]
MAVEFRLVLAGDPPVAEVAALTAADPGEVPRPTSNPALLSARLYDQRGYAITVRAGTNGYWEAEADGEARWEWEPATYVSVTFSMRADDIAEKGIPNMVAAVKRVLAGRDEDAALVQEGNYLLLTRTDGVIRTHRPDWWHHYHLDRSFTG